MDLSTFLNYSEVALGLGFVIFVHELGHFLVAKACGVKCEKFYVGFDVPIRIGPIRFPRTLFKKQWGETEYGIGIIPLGGYVKMLGQDDNPANTAKEAERIRVARENDASEQDAIDPRSYPAKTVLQRFAIISAGVIMNLIFAVIFAAVAYRYGVDYEPTTVGVTVPGLSGWQVGLQPGDRILQLGREGEPSEHLRFDKDMMVKVMMTGADEPLDLLVQRYASSGETASEPEWIQVQLSSPQQEMNGRPIIGIGPYPSTSPRDVSELADQLSHLPAVQAGFQKGDRIVGINGVAVDAYPELVSQLARRVDEDLTLDVERRADDGSVQTVQVMLPVRPVRGLGVLLEPGPIVAIQRGSVAEASGFQVGDVVRKLDGSDIENPLRLPADLRGKVGQPTVITVERGGELVDLNVTPQAPRLYHGHHGLGRPLAIEALGIAYHVTNVVAAVTPNSPAAEAGLLPGDVLQTVEFIAASDEIRALESRYLFRSRRVELGMESLDWMAVMNGMRDLVPTTEVLLTWERNGKLQEKQMAPVAIEGWNEPERGLMLRQVEQVHQVDSWAAALTLGVRETREGMRQVYFILYRLITGRFSPKNLGGPATIAYVAGTEAAVSLPNLLIFLTLLSANLAVVNFLPIPVLDGGHAMFLLYEGVVRRPMDERVAMGLNLVGFCFVLGLMLFVIGLDVWRFGSVLFGG